MTLSTNNHLLLEALVVKFARYVFVAPYRVEPWMGIVASMYELCTNRYCCLQSLTLSHPILHNNVGF